MLFPGLSESVPAYGQAPGRARTVLPCTVAGGWFFFFQNKVLFSIKKTFRHLSSAKSARPAGKQHLSGHGGGHVAVKQARGWEACGHGRQKTNEAV